MEDLILSWFTSFSLVNQKNQQFNMVLTVVVKLLLLCHKLKTQISTIEFGTEEWAVYNCNFPAGKKLSWCSSKNILKKININPHTAIVFTDMWFVVNKILPKFYFEEKLLNLSAMHASNSCMLIWLLCLCVKTQTNLTVWRIRLE